MKYLYYLYKLTLSNYIKDEAILNDPIFETLLINFLSKNITILMNQDLIFRFITYLHYELDTLFFRTHKRDTKIAMGEDFFKPSKVRLKSEVKKLSLNIRDVFLNLLN